MSDPLHTDLKLRKKILKKVEKLRDLKRLELEMNDSATIKKNVEGVFYIAFNESMPGWVKIGITKDLNSFLKRNKSLSQSTPFRFIRLWAVKIPMVTDIEAHIKRMFNPIKYKGCNIERPHGREWIYYGKNLKFSNCAYYNEKTYGKHILKYNRPWNTRGELVKLIKNALVVSVDKEIQKASHSVLVSIIPW